MASISQQIDRYNQLWERMEAGTVTNEDVNAGCKILSGIRDQQKLALACGLAALQPGMTKKKLTQLGLVGENEVIRIESRELGLEMIWCPDQDTNISREECLDYSGESLHLEACRSCKNFKSTRNILMQVEK